MCFECRHEPGVGIQKYPHFLSLGYSYGTRTHTLQVFLGGNDFFGAQKRLENGLIKDFR